MKFGKESNEQIILSQPAWGWLLGNRFFSSSTAARGTVVPRHETIHMETNSPTYEDHKELITPQS